jgi:Universal stress protein family/short chain dehydrogenase
VGERIAIVTGAARGIGAGTAIRLASHGMAVAVLDLNEADCAKTVKDSADALRWAAREAQARGTALTVCLAWPDHATPTLGSAAADLARQPGQELLARGLAYAESALGPGRVHSELVGGSAAQVLCERSRAFQREREPGADFFRLPAYHGDITTQVLACRDLRLCRVTWSQARVGPTNTRRSRRPALTAGAMVCRAR